MGRTTFSGPVVSTNGFTGALTGNITGNVTGNVTGNITGAVTATTVTASTSLAVGSGGTALTKILTGVGELTVGALAAGAQGDDTLTISGLADGDFVMVTPPNAAYEDGLMFSCYVSAANTLTVAMSNTSASPLTGSTANWRYLVIKA